MEKYDKGEEVGRGAYGVVYNGTIKATAQPVALKKMMIGNRKGDEDDGISFTALREIKYMQDHPHENIVPVRFRSVCDFLPSRVFNCPRSRYFGAILKFSPQTMISYIDSC